MSNKSFIYINNYNYNQIILYAHCIKKKGFKNTLALFLYQTGLSKVALDAITS